MPEPRDVQRQTSNVLSFLLILLGLGMVVRTLAGGGGALAIGLVLGLLFVAAGAGRLYLNGRLMRREP